MADKDEVRRRTASSIASPWWLVSMAILLTLLPISMQGGLVTSIDVTFLQYGADFCLGEPLAIILIFVFFTHRFMVMVVIEFGGLTWAHGCSWQLSLQHKQAVWQLSTSLHSPSTRSCGTSLCQCTAHYIDLVTHQQCLCRTPGLPDAVDVRIWHSFMDHYCHRKQQLRQFIPGVDDPRAQC